MLAIVALAALVIAPAMQPAEPLALERVTRELAGAVRHAREEARRLANPHGLHFEVAESRVRIYRGTPSTNPPVPNYDVEHPISTLPYEIDLSDESGIAGLGLTATASYDGTCGTPQLLGFDAAGMPRCGDPWDVLLTSMTVTVAVGAHSRSIVVHGHTGRVEVP